MSTYIPDRDVLGTLKPFLDPSEKYRLICNPEGRKLLVNKQNQIKSHGADNGELCFTFVFLQARAWCDSKGLTLHRSLSGAQMLIGPYFPTITFSEFGDFLTWLEERFDLYSHKRVIRS